MPRLGVVSFLNSRPLIDGLERQPGVELHFDVPSHLARMLDDGRVDVALVPIIDVLRSAGRYRVVSDACIACDGETMTVRIFSQLPPDRIGMLWVDGDSHTSIALASVLWRELYDRTIELRPFHAAAHKLSACESVLLIGDKVVRNRLSGFAYEIDLGAAWRQHTGLPFVFAVWAARNDPLPPAAGRLLSAARDRGVARAREIAEIDGPPRWWPVDLAVHYLTRCLKYKLDARFVEGANLFGQLCSRYGLTAEHSQIRWPDESPTQESACHSR